eukprot:SM000007S20883  [mRNA]  locus=s7:764658:774464:+ [translate_table: standard]
MGHQGSEHGPQAGARAPAALPEAAAALTGEADATSRSAMHSRSCSCFDSESDYFCNLHIDVEYLPPSNDASGGHVSKSQPGGGLAASGTSKENPAGQAPPIYPAPQAPQLAAAAALQPGQPGGPGFVLNVSTMHVDASTGNVSSIRRRIAQGEDVNAISYELGGLTALHFAAANGHSATVVALLKAGADKEARTDSFQTPLHIAAGHGRTAAVEKLLQHKADIDAPCDMGQTALHLAAALGQTSTVALLLKSGANKEARDDGDLTPLHGACETGRKATVSVLLSNGADLEAKDKFGMTPLHMAARNGKTAVVSVLLDQGDDKERTTDNGQTPVHLAAAMGRTATVDLLVRQGCNINVEDDLRQIPLHLAAASPQLTFRVVEKLLQHGARMDAQDDFGRTPVQVAMEQGGTLLLELFSSTLAAAQLEHHGARKQHEGRMTKSPAKVPNKRESGKENFPFMPLNVGQVGEAVEAALQRLGCPHALQAHQLQGLDYAAILPVAAWLLKRAQRTRKDRSKKLENYAIHRFRAYLDNTSCSLEERAQLLAWENELHIVGVPPTVQQQAQQPAEEVSASSCLWQDRQVERCKAAEEREHAVRLAVEEAGVANHDLEEVVRLLGELQGMRDRELEFKSTCRTQRAELQDSIHMLREAGNSREQSLQEVQAEELLVELDTCRQRIAALRHQLDEAPSQRELIQYERRFVELHGHIQRKLLESRGHYRMHNVVLSLSQFAAKEISLLSSIQSQFEVAMSSPAGRAKFLESMQAIVKSVEETLQRMSRKVEGELLTLAALQEKQSAELAARSTYASLVNDFQDEFSRHELLQKQLQVAATSASLGTEG